MCQEVLDLRPEDVVNVLVGYPARTSESPTTDVEQLSLPAEALEPLRVGGMEPDSPNRLDPERFVGHYHHRTTHRQRLRRSATL